MFPDEPESVEDGATSPFNTWPQELETQIYP